MTTDRLACVQARTSGAVMPVACITCAGVKPRAIIALTSSHVAAAAAEGKRGATTATKLKMG